MNDSSFVLSGPSFNTIFPFYILLDDTLLVKLYGQSIAKVMPELKEQKEFISYFTIVRPFKENINPQNFKSLLGKLVVFTSKGTNSLTLRGQFEKTNNGYLFVGSPWVNSLDELEKKNLTAEDFAYHDPLIDLLKVLKTQEINYNELKELIEIVDEQRKKLKADKEELNRLSLVASANKKGVVFTYPYGEIFWCNDAFISQTGFTRKEIIGQSLIDISKGKFSDKDEIYKMVEAFYKGEVFEVEYFHQKKKGGYFRSKITGQPIFDADGFAYQYFAVIEDITLEKEREDQLLLLSSIAEKNSNPVLISDKNGNIEWVNSSFLELTEYTLEEVIGQNPNVFLYGTETDPKTITYLESQIKNGLPFDCEIINYTKSKQKYWVKVQGQALHDKYGNIKKYFTIQEDISFEKEFNEQLIENENRLNSLIANLQSGILLEDENRKILLVNKKFCSLFSIEVEPDVLKGFDSDILSLGSKNLFKTPNHFLERITEIIDKKEMIIAEEIEMADGRVFERSFIPINSANKQQGFLWSYDDITIKKKYKESLEAEREKYSSIIANINMGLLEVDKNDVIQLANQSFCDMSGFLTSELIGQKASNLFLKNKNDSIIKRNLIEIENGISNSYEIKITVKSGEEKYWLISGASNYNVNGELIGTIGIYLDITEHKKLELQKEELLTELAKQNENLNEYAQMVSHDLKSPLRSIHTLIAWIKEDNGKEFNTQTKDYLGTIEEKVEKMDYLIQGILTYSKIDSTKLSNEMIDINVIVNNIIRIIHIPQNITVTIANELPTKSADRFRMQQLFQNLISNAVNYNDKKKGMVTIGCKEDGSNYIFYVSDNGPGIDPKYQKKIFKIFESFSSKEKSTGIGLSIVKRIVDNYKGEIWIESELGKGATFFIKLPKIHGET